MQFSRILLLIPKGNQKEHKLFQKIKWGRLFVLQIYRSNVELSLSTFWSWRHDSKSFMKPVLLTPGLSFGKTAHYKWHVRNVMDLDHPAQNDLYKIRVQNSVCLQTLVQNKLSYISSGQQRIKHHLDQTNQTVNNEGKLLKYINFNSV